jgi:hypothetical protein
MITTATFNGAYGWSGDPNCVLYRSENVVIGLANHTFAWVAFAKEHCTAMVFGYPARCRSVVHGRGALGAWVSEPPNNELGWRVDLSWATTHVHGDKGC